MSCTPRGPRRSRVPQRSKKITLPVMNAPALESLLLPRWIARQSPAKFCRRIRLGVQQTHASRGTDRRRSGEELREKLALRGLLGDRVWRPARDAEEARAEPGV